MVVDEVDTLFFFPAAIKSADCVFLHSNAIHTMRLTNTLKLLKTPMHRQSDFLGRNAYRCITEQYFVYENTHVEIKQIMDQFHKTVVIEIETVCI